MVLFFVCKLLSSVLSLSRGTAVCLRSNTSCLSGVGTLFTFNYPFLYFSLSTLHSSEQVSSIIIFFTRFSFGFLHCFWHALTYVYRGGFVVFPHFFSSSPRQFFKLKCWRFSIFRFHAIFFLSIWVICSGNGSSSLFIMRTIQFNRICRVGTVPTNEEDSVGGSEWWRWRKKWKTQLETREIATNKKTKCETILMILIFKLNTIICYDIVLNLLQLDKLNT